MHLFLTVIYVNVRDDCFLFYSTALYKAEERSIHFNRAFQRSTVWYFRRSSWCYCSLQRDSSPPQALGYNHSVGSYSTIMTAWQNVICNLIDRSVKVGSQSSLRYLYLDSLGSILQLVAINYIILSCGKSSVYKTDNILVIQGHTDSGFCKLLVWSL